jgi:hypothetical protein
MNSEVPDAKFQRFFQRLAQGGYPLFAAVIKGIPCTDVENILPRVELSNL